METKKELIVNIVPNNFVYPEIKPQDFKFGSNEVIGTVLNEKGDWRSYTPPEEVQNRNGVESAACFIEAQQHTLATIQEEQFGIADQNYSARFNLIHSRATPNGGSPLVGADSIRHDGLIPDELLPFSDDINSWSEFNSFEGGNQMLCLKEGQRWLNQWNPQYDIVIMRDEVVAEKYRKLKEALKYSPICASVYAWVQDPTTGLYIKPPGVLDNHLIEVVYIDDDNHPYVWDTYSPFLKKLEAFYNFDFGLRWSLEKKSVVTRKNWLQELISSFVKFFKDLWH